MQMLLQVAGDLAFPTLPPSLLSLSPRTLVLICPERPLSRLCELLGSLQQDSGWKGGRSWPKSLQGRDVMCLGHKLNLQNCPRMCFLIRKRLHGCPPR